MSHVMFKGVTTNENESQYYNFKKNSNLKRDISRNKSRDKSSGKSNLNHSTSNNDLLKKSYLSSKSKIDYTSEDILKQLNTNNDVANTYNDNLNNNYNNNIKSLSYTNLVKSTFSDFQKSLPNNNLDFYNLNSNLNFNSKNHENDDVYRNLKLGGNSLLKNNPSYNNFVKERIMSCNSLLDKSGERLLFEKFYDSGKTKTTNFQVNERNVDSKSKTNTNFNQLLEKLDFYKLKDKKIKEENANKKTSIYNYNFSENQNNNNIKKTNEFKPTTENKKELPIFNNNHNYEELLSKKSDFLKLKNEKSNFNINNNYSNHTKNNQSSTEEYHTFSKPKQGEDSISKHLAAATAAESFSVKKSPYSNCNFPSKEKNVFSNIKKESAEEKLNLQSELRQKNEEIRLLKSNFKKKIEFIEDENAQNMQKMELHFQQLLRSLEETQQTSRISGEDNEKTKGIQIQELLSQLKNEYLNLKSNSINLSKHEQLINQLKSQLSFKSSETNSVYESKIKEIIEYFDKPEYLNLVENMRFYVKHKDKLDFSKVDFNIEQKGNFESIREYDIWLDKIKLNLVSAETDYLNGMIALENKYNEFYYEALYDRNEKLDLLESEINAKFANFESFSYIADNNIIENNSEIIFAESNLNNNNAFLKNNPEYREENKFLKKQNSSKFNTQMLSYGKVFEENNKQTKFYRDASLGKFQSLENILNSKKEVPAYKEKLNDCNSSYKNELFNGYGSTTINTLDYLKKKISEENLLTNKNSNKNFTEKAKNFMRDFSNSNLTEGQSLYVNDIPSTKKNLQRLETLKKELKLNKENNPNSNKTLNDNKLISMRTNILNKSSNDDLEDILSKYKKTKIFLKNASIDAEKNPNNLDFLDKLNRNDSNLTKDFVFISNKKNNGGTNEKINEVAIENSCDLDDSDLDCEEGVIKEIKSIANCKSLVNLKTE